MVETSNSTERAKEKRHFVEKIAVFNLIISSFLFSRRLYSVKGLTFHLKKEKNKKK